MHRFVEEEAMRQLNIEALTNMALPDLGRVEDRRGDPLGFGLVCIRGFPVRPFVPK